MSASHQPFRQNNFFQKQQQSHTATIFELSIILRVSWICYHRALSNACRPSLNAAPKLSAFMKPLRMHCKTCSLVTSSGQLTGHRRGGEIDQSDCVIRMNDAPTRGFQQDVGQRTDVRVVAHSSLQRVLQSRQQLLNGSQVLVFWGPSSCMRRDGRGQIYNTLRLMNQLLPKLRLFSFKEETGIDRKTSNSWLSPGWFTMAIALELCDMINVYGMVPPDFCRSSSHLTVPYHYYEPWGPDECSMYLSHERSRHGSHHRFITEKMVFSNWAKTLNIHFYQKEILLNFLSKLTQRKS
uniref:Alpha-2,6-sialyltransferase n=1 Tax=Oryzias sinensis TaxID=183150 RepID=A0A8C8A9K6_9TELE